MDLKLLIKKTWTDLQEEGNNIEKIKQKFNTEERSIEKTQKHYDTLVSKAQYIY